MKQNELIRSALRKFPKAKQIAVENFVMSAPDDRDANASNLRLDKGLYNWNADTVKAIQYCLKAEGKI